LVSVAVSAVVALFEIVMVDPLTFVIVHAVGMPVPVIALPAPMLMVLLTLVMVLLPFVSIPVGVE